MNKKVRINRATWLNGRHKIVVMADDKNRSCCLGFAMRQLCRPITNDMMRHKSEPDEVANEYVNRYSMSSFSRIKNMNIFVEFDFTNTEFVNNAILFNDDPIVKNNVRENNLISLFYKNGIQLEFYGNYVRL